MVGNTESLQVGLETSLDHYGEHCIIWHVWSKPEYIIADCTKRRADILENQWSIVFIAYDDDPAPSLYPY